MTATAIETITTRAGEGSAAKATEEFAARVTDALNGGALALLISVGHRTGLFDALGALRGAPVTSADLAAVAGLSERYVREWLGGLVTGRVIEYDAARRAYRLPPEHAAVLTRASPQNLAVAAQFVAVMGAVEDQVVQAFRDGKGVPYAAYARFHEVMAEESGLSVVAALDAHILPFIGDRLPLLEAGIDVLDVGCGAGLALAHLAARFPRSRFLGIDFEERAIARARAEADRRGLTNLRFEVRDAARLDPAARFDLICAFDAIHDQARPDLVLANIRRALRPGGLFLMQDISATGHLEGDLDHPAGPWIYAISTFHCMSVSLACGGMGLGAAWGKEKALRMIREAGLVPARVEILAHDPLNFFFACEVPEAA